MNTQEMYEKNLESALANLNALQKAHPNMTSEQLSAIQTQVLIEALVSIRDAIGTLTMIAEDRLGL